jgi:hypothetical protein
MGAMLLGLLGRKFLKISVTAQSGGKMVSFSMPWHVVHVGVAGTPGIVIENLHRGHAAASGELHSFPIEG